MAILAERQERVIHVGQLRDCGLTSKAIATATAKRHLHFVHRGVRAVGTRRLSLAGRYWAAHLAVGRESTLNDVTGGAFFGIRPWAGAIHLAAPTNRRGHRAVLVHHVACLSPSWVTVRRGLPVMRPAHILLDLAARLDDRSLAVALNQALTLPVVRLAELDAVIDLRPGHRGRARLAAALDAARQDPGAGRTHSELEDLVLTLLRRMPSMPPYLRNQLTELGGRRIAKADMLFPAQRVMVELDSRKWHEQRLAMDSDRRRDQQALAAGVITFRITWRHATREWDAVAGDLVAALKTRDASRTPRTAGRS